MSDRERDNVIQKLIWYQKMGRMVTLVTELVFLGLLKASAWCDNLKYLVIGFILKNVSLRNVSKEIE
jgi:hypothetical protein